MMQRYPAMGTVDRRSVNNVFRRVHDAGQPASMAPAKASRGDNWVLCIIVAWL
jgi:hypothetical protein